ncbi:MAG TPA: hypothetical protein VIN58_18980, partial [Roseateles sp.]
VLAIMYRRALRTWPRPAQSPLDRPRKRLLLACGVAAVVVGAASACALTPAAMPAYTSRLLVRSVVWSTSCFAALFVIASAAWWRRRGDA